MDDNSKNLPRITIIMPTLNSEKTIELSLKSIRNQKYNQSLIEILVIDGGSNDNTIPIALKYGVTILKNLKIQQEYAKQLGLLNGTGKYGVFMDSDEVFLNENSLYNRIQLFESYPDLKNIISTGLLTPINYPSICDYVNSFGDAFSFSIYRLDGADLYESLAKKYNFLEINYARIINFSDHDIFPIIDSGTSMFDMEYLKEQFMNEMNSADFISTLFVRMALKTKKLGVLKDDFINHYSSSSLRNYLNKVKWRIVSNVHYSNNPGVGFSNREMIQKKLKYRKLVFIPYSVSIIYPLMDAILLTFKKKRMVYLWHFVFVYYVFFNIIINYFLKAIRFKPALLSYGKGNIKIQ